MNFDEFDPLRKKIQEGSFTLWQLSLLLGDVTGRICALDAPELKSVRKELSNAEENLVDAIDDIDARRPYEPDPADLVTVD